MSFGSMNLKAEIRHITTKTDSEGFAKEVDELIVRTRMAREGRHGTSKWANMAAFIEATDIFTMRVIPGVTIDESMYILCDGIKYSIKSVEPLRGKGMYLEITAKKVVATDGMV